MSEKFDFDDDELDEFDTFDDADDDELFERESQEEDFEERMNRETEAYLKGVDSGFTDAFAGTGRDPYEYDDEDLTDEEREKFEEGYFDGYESGEDLDE